MVGADSLAAQLAAQRLEWVPLQDGQAAGPAIHMDTASQFKAAELAAALRGGDGDKVIAIITALARDWRGIKQSDLLGAGVGSDDAAPYSPALLSMWLADRPDSVPTVALAALDQAKRARDRVRGAQGN